MADRVIADDAASRIARSVEMLVRLKVDELKGSRSQSDMICFLSDLGASAAEISSFLMLKRTTVDLILSRARSSTKPPKTARRQRSN